MPAHVQLVANPHYQGRSGLELIRALQRELAQALQAEDWARVRHLDRVCALVVERVLAVNRDDRSTLVCALSELKGVYAGLIAQCQQQISLMANY